jgi:hypothetical protein
MTTTTSIASNYSITCEDDGGIALFERRPDSWREVNPFYAKLEAKRAPQHLRVDPRTARASPVSSDAVLAQCLGEAVLTWDDNQRSLSQGWVLNAIEGRTKSLIRRSRRLALASTQRHCHRHGQYIHVLHPLSIWRQVPRVPARR